MLSVGSSLNEYASNDPNFLLENTYISLITNANKRMFRSTLIAKCIKLLRYAKSSIYGGWRGRKESLYFGGATVIVYRTFAYEGNGLVFASAYGGIHVS